MDELKAFKAPDRYIEKLKSNPDLCRNIAEMLVQGLPTLDIASKVEEEHGRGFRTAIYLIVDSGHKAIQFVRQYRPESTDDEIKKIWFNRGKGTRHFRNL